MLIQLKLWLGINVNNVIGIIGAMIFFGMNRWFMPRRHRTITLAIAAITLIPSLIIFLLYGVGYIQSR